MYVVPLKTAVVEALRNTFTATYPEPDFRNILIDIEFPVEQSRYPGLFVQYEDTDELSIAGISHIEREYTGHEAGDTYYEYTRWRFQGSVSVTAVALSSLERDRLYDEVVRTFAFNKQNKVLSPFRRHIEDNGLIAVNANFDDLRPFGDSATQGTPWLTDEIIYEKSISFNLQGEFTGDPDTKTIVPLREIITQSYVEGLEPPPTWPDGPFPPGGDSNTPADRFDPTQWH